MTLPSENGGIVLVNDTSKRVTFDTWPTTKDQKSANWSLIPVIGRSEPIPIYQSSEARRLAVTLRMVASDSQKTLPATDEVEEMKKRLDFLKSLTYPQRVGRFNTHPPLVWVIIGDHINVKGFINSCNISYIDVPWEIDEAGAATHPMVADVAMEVTVVNDFTIDAETVRVRGDNFPDIHPGPNNINRGLLN